VPAGRPFAVNVPDEALADLRRRLEHARFPDEVPGSGWRYGADLASVRALAAYWRDGYDWRAQERRLNAWPQRMVALGDLDVHCVVAEGKGPRPLPLLLSHGWPGSVWEFHRLIPLLADPGGHGADPADAFTVVAPSLPGYAFSFRPGQRRLSVPEIADVLAELMGALGHPRFGAHGGDWGCLVAARLGHAHAARLAGIHVTNAFVRPPRSGDLAAHPEVLAYGKRAREWQREEAGYQAIQGTRPQTLAYALTDSPVGLLAWLLEKYRAWSDCGGDVERRFGRDVLLTAVTIYWVTGAIGSSFWPYYAHRHEPWLPSPEAPVAVPTGYADFPAEIVRPPRVLVERVFDLRRWTSMAAGGHFAALEEPEALAEDIRAFFRDGG
jgi:microsomal epoxide hydrolase